MSTLVFDTVDDLVSKIKLPPKMAKTVADLMDVAEDMFATPGSGPAKKRWVRDTVVDLFSKVDIKGLPNWIENPLKEALVEGLIEIVWELLYKRRVIGA